MSRRHGTSTAENAPDLKGFDDFDLRLGDIMRGERATMGKSLLDVQRELKIKANYIAAIENTDPSAFETPGFIAGYVRSYARYLGLDPEWAFKTFCDEGDFAVAHGMSADASVRRTSKPQSKALTKSELRSTPAHLRDPFTQPSVSYMPRGEAILSGLEPRAIGSVLVLIALIGGIGYGGWAVLQEVQKVRFTPVDQTPDVLAELDPMAAAAPTEDVAGADVSNIAPTTTAFDRLYRPEALDVPVMAARDGPIATINPDTIGALAPQRGERVLSADMPSPDFLPQNLPRQAATVRGPDQVIASLNSQPQTVKVVEDVAPSVALIAVRPSWVRVTAADGTVVFEKILDAGETFDVPLTEAPATLRAGNSGSLYFTVNGQTYGPAGNGPAVVKNVTLAPDALKDSYAVADIDSDSDLARFIAVAEANASD
ncbi:MAG: helix-turn-helix domain-containing protein [Pseudomonadota bacterium]